MKLNISFLPYGNVARNTFVSVLSGKSYLIDSYLIDFFGKS